MKQRIFILVLLVSFNLAFSQKLLMSWSQQNIENYTREMYDAAQKLSSKELLEKNLQDKYWSEVFLTLNASVNHHSADKEYLKSLADQITDNKSTKLQGTSRLIIWDRIVSGEIIFEGKGLVFANDLFTVSGRANQILQSLTKKNFGNVNINSTKAELENLKKNWIDYLSDKPVNDYKPKEFKNAKISEISSLMAVNALIISLQDNQTKNQITKKCL